MRSKTTSTEENSTEGLKAKTKNSMSSSSVGQELDSDDYNSLIVRSVDTEADVGHVRFHERSLKAVQLEIVLAVLLLIGFDRFPLSSAFQCDRPQFSTAARRNGGCSSGGKSTITHRGQHRQKQDFFAMLFGTQTDDSGTDPNLKTSNDDERSQQQQQKKKQKSSFGWGDFKRLIYDGVDNGMAALLMQDDVQQKESYYEKSTRTRTNDNIRKGYVLNSYISGVADPERPKKASTRIANDVIRTGVSTRPPATTSSFSSSTASSPVRPEPVVSLQKQNRQNDIPRDLMLGRQAAEVSIETSSMVDGEAAANSRPSSKWKTRARDKSTNTIAISSLEIRSRPSINRRLSQLDQKDSMYDQRQALQKTQQSKIATIDKERTNENRRRLENDMKIREEEAKRRALIRNEVYDDPPTITRIDSSESDRENDKVTGVLVETILSGIEGLPETLEKTVTNTISVTKSIPGTIQALPEQVEEQVRVTKKSIEAGADATQQVAKDIRDIPIKVSKSVENTQQSLREAQKSLEDVVTNTKVLVGLEKPKPKPPKVDPPPARSAKDLTIDFVGKASGLTGKVAWWTGKQTAKLAWKGTQMAVTKGIETLTPVVEEAWDEVLKDKQLDETNDSLVEQECRTGDTKKAKMKPHPPVTLPPDEKNVEDEYTPRQKQFISKIKTQEELDREIAEAQSLAEEVAAALELAEQALKVSRSNTSRGQDPAESLDGSEKKYE